MINNNVEGRINAVYLIVAEDVTELKNTAFYKVEKMLEGANLLELQKCYQISKTEYTKLIENNKETIKTTKASHLKIPYSKIIKITNIIYNK